MELKHDKKMYDNDMYTRIKNLHNVIESEFDFNMTSNERQWYVYHLSVPMSQWTYWSYFIV